MESNKTSFWNQNGPLRRCRGISRVQEEPLQICEHGLRYRVTGLDVLDVNICKQMLKYQNLTRKILFLSNVFMS